MSENVQNDFRLSAPWITYQRKLEALFEKDPDIEVGQLYETEDGCDLWVYIHTEKKYEAFKAFFPAYITFGNVKVKITPKLESDSEKVVDVVDAIKNLFEGNGRVQDIKDFTDVTGAEQLFIRFKPEVVQFFNDDTTDLNGNWSGLAQDIARDVLDIPSVGIHFCTAPIEDKEE